MCLKPTRFTLYILLCFGALQVFLLPTLQAHTPTKSRRWIIAHCKVNMSAVAGASGAPRVRVHVP